jgi:Ca2+-binding EF-hand superfamily protein
MLDTDKDGLLSITEFRKAIRDHRIDVTDSEVDLVRTSIETKRV